MGRDHILCIYSSVDGHLICFHLPAVVNRLLWTLVYKYFFEHLFPVLLCVYLGGEPLVLRFPYPSLLSLINKMCWDRNVIPSRAASPLFRGLLGSSDLPETAHLLT